MSTISTVGSSHFYTTITAWNNAGAALATPFLGGWIGEGYNDSEFLNDAGGSGGPTLSGTTTVTNFMILRTATGQSAWDNNANALTYDQTKGCALRTTVSYSNALTLACDWVTVQGWQMSNDSTGNSSKIVDISSFVGNLTFDRNLLIATTTYFGGYLFGLSPYSKPVTISNNVMLSGGQFNHGFNMVTGAALVFVNNTILQASNITSTGKTAFHDPYGGAGATIINCAGFGFASGFCNTTTSTGNNNATDAASFGFTSISSLTSQTYANQFVGITSTTWNAKLKTGSSLIDAGFTATALMPGTLAIDIFGTSRPQGSAWDIGAHELISGGPVGLPTGVQFFTLPLRRPQPRTLGLQLGTDILLTELSGQDATTTGKNRAFPVPLGPSRFKALNSLKLGSKSGFYPPTLPFGRGLRYPVPNGPQRRSFTSPLGSPFILITSSNTVTATGTIGIDITPTGVGAAFSQSTGSVALNIALLGSGVATIFSTGSIGIEIDPLGVGTGISNTIGSIGVNIDLAGSGASSAVSAGSIALNIGVSGDGLTTVNGVGSITLNLAQAGAGTSIVSSDGDITLDISLSGTGVSSARANGTIGLDISVSGFALGARTGTGSIGLDIDVDGIANAIAQSIGTISLDISQSGVGNGFSLSAGSIDLNIDPVAFGGSAASGVGRIGLNIGVIGVPLYAAVPVFSIMRNIDVPSIGGMNNTVIACEGEFV